MTAEDQLANSLGVDYAIEQTPIGTYLINYIVAGKGKPLLLLHGANIGWGQWYRNIGELSMHFTVYAIDLPGAGFSTKINFRKINFQKDFIDIISKFITEKKLLEINVIGHSIGGWLATQLVLHNKDLVRMLVLVDPLGFTHQIPHQHRLMAFYPFAKLLSEKVFSPTPKHMRKFLESVMYNPSSLDQNLVEYLAVHVQRDSMRHPFFFINRLITPLGIRKEFILTKNELSSINQNTLIIMGDKDPLIMPKRVAEKSAHLPNVHIEIFPDTGHIPPIEKYHRFNKTVLEFFSI